MDQPPETYPFYYERTLEDYFALSFLLTSNWRSSWLKLDTYYFYERQLTGLNLRKKFIGIDKEIAINLILVSMTLVFLVLIAVGEYYHRQADAVYMKSLDMSVPSSLLIGRRTNFLGRADARYTLVEFADYQCPPCRSISPAIRQILHQYPNVKFDFRNYPLTQIHPMAMAMAISAESARVHGQFWQVHDLLMEANPDNLNSTTLVRSHLTIKEKKEVIDRIRADMKLGDQIGIRGTPTLILCTPEGKTIRLPDTSLIGQYVH